MDLAIKLIVLLPLLAAAIAGLFCRVIGDRPAQVVTCAALLIAAALSIFVFIRIGFGPENAKLVVVKLFTWMDSGTLDVAWSLIGIGLVAGILGALAVTRLMSSLLYGVSSSDLSIYAIVTIVLSGAALIATYFPARRAMTVDPMVALRYE